jgi:RNA polymerase sigma-70 factor (family 1)
MTFVRIVITNQVKKNNTGLFVIHHMPAFLYFYSPVMTTTASILPNEKELFTRLSQGDQAAFTTIFYHYTQRIYTYILYKVKSPETAEEIVQELFIKVWQSREQFVNVQRYESFLFSMASNKVVDFFRQMAHQEKVKKDVWRMMQEISNVTIEELDLRHSQALIHEAVSQLSPQRRKIFQMNKEQGMSRQEIADQLGLSVNTVNNHLNEAVRLVKEYLDHTPGASLAVLLFLAQVLPVK